MSVTPEFDAFIQKKADAMNISKSKYCYLAFTKWIINDGELRIREK